MNERDWLAEQFEHHRPHLRTVAYRMLGSITDSEDAVQEAWLRLSRTNQAAIEDIGAWLTTVVGRVSLDILRRRRSRQEDYVGSWLPEPIVTTDPAPNPEQEALIADSVGLALLVVLETLTPNERLAFVLHDMFAVPFDEIAQIIDRSPEAARQLASRARRRVQSATPDQDADLGDQRKVIDAFLAASRAGDFEGLLAVLDPDVVFRVDAGSESRLARAPLAGAEAVARQILARGTPLAPLARSALVNGAAGVVVGPERRPIAVVGFTVVRGRITDINLVVDPDKLPTLSGS
ncbi:MAG TPA: RNA polymerase sigma factor SigJ [Gaiellaceae bacterium]|nr:RNA polymerase sigma factor SigJ [Gaiellaceae bacterium]